LLTSGIRVFQKYQSFIISYKLSLAIAAVRVVPGVVVAGSFLHEAKRDSENIVMKKSLMTFIV
jgi:hypothetical protein